MRKIRSVVGAIFLIAMAGCGPSDAPPHQHRAASPQTADITERTELAIDRGGTVTGYTLMLDGTWMASKTLGHRIIVDVSINGSAPLPFIVDTGSPNTFLLRSCAVGWRVGSPTMVSFPMVQAPVEGLRTTGNSLRLGAFQFVDFPITVVDVPALTQEGVAGLIGDDILSRFRITIDYDKKLLILDLD